MVKWVQEVDLVPIHPLGVFLPLGRMDLLLTFFCSKPPQHYKKKKMFILACRIQSATVNSFSLYAEDCD